MNRNQFHLFAFVGLLFLLLGFFGRNLGLYLDDVTFALPIQAGTAIEYAVGYLRNFSFFRALALPYYYLVYDFFLKFGGIAHLIPLLLYVWLLKLVFEVLQLQGLSSKTAALTTVLIAMIPFWTEVYGWFAASNALIAYILLFAQLKLVMVHPDVKKTWLWMGLLQVGIVFLYDTVFFMPLSMSYIWLISSKERVTWLAYLKRVIFLFLPAASYLVLRMLYPPVVATRIKLVSLPQIWNNWNSFVLNFKDLLSVEYVQHFWLERLQIGSSLIKESWLSIILFMALLVVVTAWLHQTSVATTASLTTIKKAKFFWLLSFGLSLLPISLQEHYLSFRLLVIPLSCLLFWLAFTAMGMQHGWMQRLRYFVDGGVVLLFGASLMLQVGLLGGYHQIYQDDLATITQIDSLHTQHGFNFQDKATIYLHNYPVNTSGIYPYGDYGVSIFKYNWAAQYFNALEHVTWQEFLIDSERESWFSGSVSREVSQQIRPLLVIEFDNHCGNNVCLRVGNVKR